jgi:hypothetical protein
VLNSFLSLILFLNFSLLSGSRWGRFMNLEEVKELKLRNQLKAVNFIESGHAPMVIELVYTDNDQTFKALLKNDHGDVITCHNLKEGYNICLDIGVRVASLVQIETDDETTVSDYADYCTKSIPLSF